MECWRTSSLLAVLIYLSFKVNGLCQNVTPGKVTVRESRDCTRPPQTSSDKFNSVLTAAASNGILPDLIPILQGQPIVDNFQRNSYPQDILTKPLSVVPMPTSGINRQEPIIVSSQPIRPSTSNQNLIVATPFPCGSSCPSNVIPAIPQTISPPVVSPSNCVSQIAQALPLENYPVCAQNIDVVRPMPIVLQPQCQFNEVNPYNFYNQITDTISLPDVNIQPLNFPILPSSQSLSPITTCSGGLDIAPNLGPSCLTQPIVFASDGQQIPLSLQINVPTPSVPAPRITVVSTNPSNSPVSVPSPSCPDYPANFPPYQFPPQPPIVIGGGSKSSLRNLLPIILLALLSDRGCNNDGGGCCRCCCSCSGNSGNNIPIPYPIPIPINNPVLNTFSNARNRDGKDDGDDDEDQRK